MINGYTIHTRPANVGIGGHLRRVAWHVVDARHNKVESGLARDDIEAQAAAEAAVRKLCGGSHEPVSLYSQAELTIAARKLVPVGRVLVGWALEVRNQGARLVAHHKARGADEVQTSTQAL